MGQPTEAGLASGWLPSSPRWCTNTSRSAFWRRAARCRERESLDLTDVLIKRYVDIDVDTGGSAGWAGFAARGPREARAAPARRSYAERHQRCVSGNGMVCCTEIGR